MTTLHSVTYHEMSRHYTTNYTTLQCTTVHYRSPSTHFLHNHESFLYTVELLRYEFQRARIQVENIEF